MRTPDELREVLTDMADEVQATQPLRRARVRRVWGYRAAGIAAAVAVVLGVVSGGAFVAGALDREPPGEGPASSRDDGASSGTVAGKTWTISAARNGDSISVELTVDGVRSAISSPLVPEEDLYRSVTRVGGIGDRVAIFGYATERVERVEVFLEGGTTKTLDFVEPGSEGLPGHLFVAFEPMRSVTALAATTADGTQIRDEIDYRALDPPSTPAGELVASGKVGGRYWEVRTFARYDYSCAVVSLAPDGMGEGSEVCGYPDPIATEEYYLAGAEAVLFFGVAPNDVERVEVRYSDGARMPLEMEAFPGGGSQIVYGTSTRVAGEGEVVALDAAGEVVYRESLDTAECIETLPGFSGTCG